MLAVVVLVDEVDREAGEEEEAGSEAGEGEVEADFKLRDSSVHESLPSVADREISLQIAGQGRNNLETVESALRFRLKTRSASGLVTQSSYTQNALMAHLVARSSFFLQKTRVQLGCSYWC